MSASGQIRRDFLSVVSGLALLGDDVAIGLVQEAAQRGISATQLAMQLGLLDAVQVDIVETLLHPGEVVPGYELLSVIGHGGMGVVYRARQKALDRIVALKTVLVNQMADATSVFRFEQEARSVAKLRHPNVVAAYDFGRQGGRLYFAMELVEGEDLEELIRQRGRLDEATAWGLARQAAAGLAHAHQQGIVHRDIKPANLLLIAPPEGFSLPAGLPMVKIADFGLAFLTTEAETRTRLTAANRTVGSPHYVAPELLCGTAVDYRADIYSLGATVFHMVSGRAPFAGKSLTQILTEKINKDSPPLSEHAPGVSQPTAALVAEMMARQPDQRIGNYAELMRRIDALSLTGLLPTLALPQASAYARSADTATLQKTDTLRDTAAPRHRLWPWLVAGVLLLGMLGAAAWIVHNRDHATALPPRDMVPSGWGDWLFDGRSLEGWSARGGTWTTRNDEEGAGVISGTEGVFRRSFPSLPREGQGSLLSRPIENYRITASFRLHEAAAVGFHFGIAPASDQNGPRFVLRITPAGAVLGELPNDAGPFTAIGPTLPLPQDATRLYCAVQVERQHGHFWAFLIGTQANPHFVGAIPARDVSYAPEFRLSASGEGPAYFGDIRLEELVPRP